MLWRELWRSPTTLYSRPKEKEEVSVSTILSCSLFMKHKACFFIAQTIMLLLYSDNNYYNNDLHGMLEKIGGSVEREAYILMDKLRPPALPNLFLGSHPDEIDAANLVCELGVFGVYVRLVCLCFIISFIN